MRRASKVKAAHANYGNPTHHRVQPCQSPGPSVETVSEEVLTHPWVHQSRVMASETLIAGRG